jgi:hypothetical protein
MPEAVTSELSAWSNESTAAASSSEIWHSLPSPLPGAPRVKYESDETSTSSLPFGGPHPGYPDYSAADTTTYVSTSSTLTCAPSPRLSRPPTLQPSPIHLNPTTATLFPSRYNQTTQHSQDVLPSVNSPSFSDTPDTARQHGSSRSPLLEHFPPSCAVSNNVPVNSSWTPSHPVFTNPTALAAHHGIPQSLPPVPRTTRYTTTENQASTSSSSNDFDFSILRENYLTMLSQKPADSMSAAAPETPDAVQAVLDLLIGNDSPLDYPQISPANICFLLFLAASPEFQSLGSEFPADYLTSPMDESPWEQMLTTPALGSSDYMTSPAIVDSDDFGFGEAPLFGDSGFNASLEPIKTAMPAPVVQHPPSFDGLYTMASPDTPSLDPSSLSSSVNATPITPALHSFKSPARRKNPPTGTRKNISPDALIPYDAPVQPRKYATPSATSRKEVPAVFAKKRSRSQAFDEEGEDMPLDPEDVDAIEAKRRQNTLAARRSRKRKLEYQRELEASIEKANDEKQFWISRAMTLENTLREHGLEVPSLPLLP